MKAPTDQKTGDLLPNYDLVGERPEVKDKPQGRAFEDKGGDVFTQREKGAARVAKYREKNGVKPMTVNIPADLADDFDAYLARTGKRRSDVIAQVLRTQVLRKR